MAGFIAGLPKAELHVHHVGSASPAIVSELAMRHPGVVPVDPDELRRFFEFRDFAHFVEVYLAVVDLIRTEDDVRYLTYEVARELATHQQVRYAELTCTPYTSVLPHDSDRGMPIEVYTEAIEDARIAAERDFGIVLRWIYDIPGESGMPAADATLSFALNNRTDALVGFGLGGPEQGVPRGQFQPHFDHARRAGLHSVPHAGETTGPETIWDAATTARRRADRTRHLGCRRPEAARPPGRDGHPARGVPLVEHRHPGGGQPRGAPDHGVPRRRRHDHRQLRRPVDVRHQPQPGVRGGGATARPRHRGGRPTWPAPRSAPRSRQTT